MTDSVLTSLWLGLIHISLCLQYRVFILNALYLAVTVGKCCIFFFDGLQMISFILFTSCCRIRGNITLQQYFLKFFAFAVDLKIPCIPFPLM